MKLLQETKQKQRTHQQMLCDAYPVSCSVHSRKSTLFQCSSGETQSKTLVVYTEAAAAVLPHNKQYTVNKRQHNLLVS